MKISELPELTELAGDEYLPIVQNGTTYKIAASLLGGNGAATVPENAFDDEFEGNTLNSSWLWQNQALSTASVSSGSLNLSKALTGASQNQISSLYKPAPIPPWTVTTKFTVLGDDVVFTNQGLMLGDDTGKITTFNSGWGSGYRRIEIYNFINPNTFSSASHERAVSGLAGGKGTAYFSRIVNNGVDLRFHAAGAEADLALASSLIFSRALGQFLPAVARIGFNMESRNGNAGLSVDWIKLVTSA